MSEIEYYEKQKYRKSDTASGIESIIYLEERADVKQRQRHRRADDDRGGTACPAKRITSGA